MRIAMIGTRGVPARYGGFETAVEEIGKRLATKGRDVTVYCRTSTTDERVGDTPLTTYEGMRLVHLPAVKKRSVETLSHTTLSVGHALTQKYDAAFVFNAANSPLLPVLRAAQVPVATHVDGLEWRRDKWNGIGKQYYRVAEQLAVRWSDALIADAQGIADYYSDEFAAPTVVIPYGAPILESIDLNRLRELGLEKDRYHLVVARFEPENHVHIIMEGYAAANASLPLVVVGSAPYSGEYTASLEALAGPNVRMLGGVWDAELLDQLYAGALTYQHGHSVGGTNPSLLRAIGAGAAVDAYDVVFNREVLGDAGRFFRTSNEVAALIESAEANPHEVAKRSELSVQRAHDYTWDDVADRYDALASQLHTRSFPRRRPSGKRRGAKQWEGGL